MVNGSWLMVDAPRRNESPSSSWSSVCAVAGSGFTVRETAWQARALPLLPSTNAPVKIREARTAVAQASLPASGESVTCVRVWACGRVGVWAKRRMATATTSDFPSPPAACPLTMPSILDRRPNRGPFGPPRSPLSRSGSAERVLLPGKPRNPALGDSGLTEALSRQAGVLQRNLDQRPRHHLPSATPAPGPADLQFLPAKGSRPYRFAPSVPSSNKRSSPR